MSYNLKGFLFLKFLKILSVFLSNGVCSMMVFGLVCKVLSYMESLISFRVFSSVSSFSRFFRLRGSVSCCFRWFCMCRISFVYFFFFSRFTVYSSIYSEDCMVGLIGLFFMVDMCMLMVMMFYIKNWGWLITVFMIGLLEKFLELLNFTGSMTKVWCGFLFGIMVNLSILVKDYFVGLYYCMFFGLCSKNYLYFFSKLMSVFWLEY